MNVCFKVGGIRVPLSTKLSVILEHEGAGLHSTAAKTTAAATLFYSILPLCLPAFSHTEVKHK